MTGKMRIWLACSAAALAALWPCASRAIPVEDPISYTYYVQQIKKMETQIKDATQQIQQLQQMNTQLQSMTGDLQGQYNRAAGLLQSVKDTEGDVTSIPSTLQQQDQEFAGQIEGLGSMGSGAGDFTSAGAALDGFFKDPRTTGGDNATVRTGEYQVRQTAYKHAVEQASNILANMKARFATITTLSSEIDQTKNVKDAQDLTNRILIELLRTMTTMLAVDARLTQAMGLAHYQGVNDSETAARLKQIQADQKSTGGYLGTLQANLKAQGVDPNDMTGKDLQKLATDYNQSHGGY